MTVEELLEELHKVPECKRHIVNVCFNSGDIHIGYFELAGAIFNTENGLQMILYGEDYE